MRRVAIASATLLRANGEEIATAMGTETIEDDEGDDWLEVEFAPLREWWGR